MGEIEREIVRKRKSENKRKRGKQKETDRYEEVTFIGRIFHATLYT